MTAAVTKGDGEGTGLEVERKRRDLWNGWRGNSYIPRFSSESWEEVNRVGASRLLSG